MRPFALAVLILVFAAPASAARPQQPEATPGCFFMIGRHAGDGTAVDRAAIGKELREARART